MDLWPAAKNVRQPWSAMVSHGLSMVSHGLPWSPAVSHGLPRSLPTCPPDIPPRKCVGLISQGLPWCPLVSHGLPSSLDFPPRCAPQFTRPDWAPRFGTCTSLPDLTTRLGAPIWPPDVVCRLFSNCCLGSMLRCHACISSGSISNSSGSISRSRSSTIASSIGV